MATTAAKAFPWLESLQRSLDNNPDPTSRWPSLATINAKTQPTARIVAFRGFVKDHIDEAAQKNINPAILNSIIFTTDARSAKIEELQQRRDAALCWYFQDTREQHRFQGTMRIVAGPEWEWREKELSGWNDCGVDWEEVRRAEYAKMSPTMKATFTHPPPKSPLLANTAYEAALTDTASPAQHAAALKNFALLVFKVHEADRLDLRPQPYLRELGGSREGSEEWESAETHHDINYFCRNLSLTFYDTANPASGAPSTPNLLHQSRKNYHHLLHTTVAQILATVSSLRLASHTSGTECRVGVVVSDLMAATGEMMLRMVLEGLLGRDGEGEAWVEVLSRRAAFLKSSLDGRFAGMRVDGVFSSKITLVILITSSPHIALAKEMLDKQDAEKIQDAVYFCTSVGVRRERLAKVMGVEEERVLLPVWEAIGSGEEDRVGAREE